jgi:acyl-CoA synthetase (AMP-forming)/AMP-acid ligase II
LQECPNKKGDAKVIESIVSGALLSNFGPESDGMVFFTSGTTSMPKAVLSTQRAGCHNFISGNYSEYLQPFR